MTYILTVCYFCSVEFLAGIVPESVPRLVIQAIAGPLAGITATFITNPLDVSRTRLQVSVEHLMSSKAFKYRKY